MLKAVVIGAMNLDLVGVCGQTFRAGDSIPGSVVQSPGGVGRNLGANLARLGFGVSLLTVLGSDSRSAWLEERAAAEGLDLGLSLRRDGPAPTYLAVLDEGGGLRAAVADMGLLEALDPGWIEAAAERLDAADLLVVDANVPGAVIDFVASRYGRGGFIEGAGRPRPLLALDPVSTAKAPRCMRSYAAFDLAKPNRAEAAVLAGLAGPLPGEPEALAAALRAAHPGLGPELFISLGPRGLFYEGLGAGGYRERGIVAPPPLPVVDVTGAGDAALAALAWATLAGSTLAERAALAAAASALTASARGAVSPALAPETLFALAKGA